MSVWAVGCAAAVGALSGPGLAHLADRVPDGWAAVRRRPYELRRARRYSVLAALVCAPLGLLGWPAAAPAIVFTLAAMPLCAIDLRLHRLPDLLVLPAIGVQLALLAGLSIPHHLDHLASALAVGAGLFVLLYAGAVISPSAMGFGDVKLSALVGMTIGWFGAELLVLWLVGMLVAILVSLVIERRRFPDRPRGARAPVAFGPGMLGGAWLALLAVAVG